MKAKIKTPEKEKTVNEPRVVYDKQLDEIKSITIISGKYDDIKGFDIKPQP